jgi:two-component system, OmpR family, phosphate regulon sensor histidine kinase PhoR
METEIDNLTQLVNELLELSRIESGKVPLSFHRITPCDLLNPACERMELQVERAGLELILDCQPNLPVVFADPDRITQVVINLIHNAIKFTPPGGQITSLLTRMVILLYFLSKTRGWAFPRMTSARIFERFYKADRARSGGGTGLGFPLPGIWWNRMGVLSGQRVKQDMGSTLYFSLPVA